MIILKMNLQASFAIKYKSGCTTYSFYYEDIQKASTLRICRQGSFEVL